MKKLLALILLLSICLNANAFTVQSTLNEDFSSSSRYSVRNIDTNGEIYVGVLNDTLITSTDFSYWQRNPDITGIADVKYINNTFCAYAGGFTYTSTDGISWEKHENNLPHSPDADYIIKNNNSVVAFHYEMGTYQTYDGINWSRVKNIPDGIPMNIINGKIMFFSDGYMRGLYYSDTGESFTKAEIPGFKESYGGRHIRYANGEYMLDDYWTPVDDEAYYTVHYSTDLVNWSSRLEPRGELIHLHGSFVEIAGEAVEFSLNGYGKYDMSAGGGAFPPYVFYNFTDYGVFGWSTANYSYFVKNDGTMLTFDGREMCLVRVYVNDGMFYGVTKNNELLKSETGEKWVKTEETIVEPTAMNSGSNGEVTLTSQFIERGSQAGRDINEEITAELKYPDGTLKQVVYEYAKDDYVKVIGGNGYFLLGGFSEADDGWYYSRDGITREFKVGGLGTSRDMHNYDVLSNGKHFITFSIYSSTMSYGEMGQLENISGLERNVTVTLNGQYLSFATPPVIQNERTLIPVRFLFECAGAEVNWEHETSSVTITYGDTTVKLKIGDDTAYVNGVSKKLDVAPQLINNKTLIPLRFISEELGFNVDWDGDGYTAIVNTK